MNDRFKLRAWDECNNKMHYDFQFITSGDSANDWIIFQSDKQKLDWETNEKFSVNVYPNPYFAQQLKIMQCTGLEDKNGKLIYESDIVKVKEKDSSLSKIQIAEIQYKPKYTAFVVLSEGVFGYLYNESLLDLEIEVIGNIYENEDLLDVENNQL